MAVTTGNSISAIEQGGSPLGQAHLCVKRSISRDGVLVLPYHDVHSFASHVLQHSVLQDVDFHVANLVPHMSHPVRL